MMDMETGEFAEKTLFYDRRLASLVLTTPPLSMGSGFSTTS